MESLIKSVLSSSLIALTLIVSNHSVIASDREKEKRWAEQISDSLLDGDAVYLNDGEADFLAIDTQAEEPKETGLIIIHGIGIHPDWETVIQPLRVELATNGWNTLSLQMPILGNDASGKDYDPLMKEVPSRIDAGIRYLAKAGTKKVIIIAHSLGARMANHYLANKKVYQESQSQTPITAYVAIGLNTSNNSKDFGKIKIPVFDLLGEKDLDGVVASAKLRKQVAMSNNNYSQKIIAGAGHFFEGQDDELVKAVNDALLKFEKH